MTGIATASHIMVDQVATMPRANARGRVGRLSDADPVRLDRALGDVLGLAD